MAASGDNIIILRHAIDEAIESLGGPIHKTITWHMNNRGIFADSKIDIDLFYSNLKELVGPGADLIMEETWEHMQKQGLVVKNFESKLPPIEKIRKMMKIGESA
jgi:hypothetical protein